MPESRTRLKPVDQIQSQPQASADGQTDGVLEAAEILSESVRLMIVQLRQQQREVNKHYRKYGHLFAVDADGNILFSPNGTPVCMELCLTRSAQMSAFRTLLDLCGDAQAKALAKELAAKDKERRAFFNIEDDPIFRVSDE